MHNTIGNNIKLTLIGESHGPYVGAILEGLEKGIRVDENKIAYYLSKRRPRGNTETKRVEEDNFEIISGVKDGFTDGDKIEIRIENKNINDKDYDAFKDLARPGHADYVSYVKYGSVNNGGGIFSGRMTAGIVAIGGILIPYLESKGIKIATHILNIDGVKDLDLLDECAYDEELFDKYVNLINSKDYPVINDIADEMNNHILEYAKNKNSIGGISQTVITGIKAGLGDSTFDSIEGSIASAIFGIGGIKGIEFGKGFDIANMSGKDANDELFEKDDKVYTKTNNNGGINGGIANGMPILFNCAIKPTPSIGIKQDTINMKTLENTSIEIAGRHDPCIVRRVSIVITCLTAFVIEDLLKSE